MSNQPKPAATAEEQLPLHIQNLYEDSKRDDYMIVGSEVRMVVYELRKALRSNREKDAKIAELENQTRQREKRIIEQSVLVTNLYSKMNAAEAKLRAVSGKD